VSAPPRVMLLYCGMRTTWKDLREEAAGRHHVLVGAGHKVGVVQVAAAAAIVGTVGIVVSRVNVSALHLNYQQQVAGCDARISAARGRYRNRGSSALGCHRSRASKVGVNYTRQRGGIAILARVSARSRSAGRASIRHGYDVGSRIAHHARIIGSGIREACVASKASGWGKRHVRRNGAIGGSAEAVDSRSALAAGAASVGDVAGHRSQAAEAQQFDAHGIGGGVALALAALRRREVAVVATLPLMITVLALLALSGPSTGVTAVVPLAPAKVTWSIKALVPSSTRSMSCTRTAKLLTARLKVKVTLDVLSVVFA
nr:hypothetical protein [Tanacetum cinerariifolium]